MEYLSVSISAERWRITPRQVQRLLAANRITGAKKHGRDWLIPENAEKPGDPRFKKAEPAQMTLEYDLSRAIEITFISFPRDDPDSVLNIITDDKLRLLPEASLAYLRGDFVRVRNCYMETEGDDAVKLLISAAAIPAAISLGDYPFFLDIENWLKSIIQSNPGAGVAAYAEMALATGYLGASAPGMVTDWIKNGDFTNLHPQARPEAFVRRLEYFRYLKKHESILDTVQAVISMFGMEVFEKEISTTIINLLIKYAFACFRLNRTDEAKHWIMKALDIALPHGFITHFAETITTLGGLTEVCLKQSYPMWYDAVIEQADRTVGNWVSFHNQFTKDNIPLILTVQEVHVATMAARKVSRANIAKQLNYSQGWVDKTINVIYEKLMINNRDDLAKYIL